MRVLLKLGVVKLFLYSPIGTRTIALDPSFGKFYLIKTNFISDELLSFGESVLDCLDWN
jgi:hypothetical protein